jgi:hypothetical protein
MAVVNKFDLSSLKNNPSNVQAVDLQTIIGDGTKFFNNYFNKPISISTAKDDAIVAYFEGVTRDNHSAMVLASAVIYTSASLGVDPMTVLDEFKKLDKGVLNSYLCQLLNLNRVGTSLLGVKLKTPRNKYVSRTIIQ